MSLFVINRYEGEKEAETKTENKHLSELLKRIEERKRERNLKKENFVAENDDEQYAKKDDRKRKKRKRETDNESVVENVHISEDARENNVETEFTSPQKSHKKKKKKEKNLDDTKTNVNGESIEANDEKLPTTITDNQNDQLLNTLENVNNEEKTNFMVLGVKHKKKKQEVKRVLPEWLANPNIISNDLNDGPSLDNLNSVLDIKLIEVLKANGIDKLFPVQSSMISWLLKCNEDKQQGWWLRDTCVSAPTGSGMSS